MQPPVIEAKDLSFRAGGSVLLEGLSFKIERGAYVGLLGPNGGGKTTLLKLILGLNKPTSGEILLFGQQREKFKDHHKIGYVPQHHADGRMNFPASVAEVIETGLAPRLMPWRRMDDGQKRQLDEAIELAQVGALLKRNLAELSGGERQRVYIARALAAQPELLLLDEPLTGVDAAAQQRFYSFLADLNGQLNLSLVFVSHDLGAIAGQVNQVLCLNKRLMCEGPPENFIKEEMMERIFGPETQSVFHHHH